jgi:hypothetical protein
MSVVDLEACEVRAPKRRRPRKSDRLDPAGNYDLDEIADKAKYIVSAEHKDYLTNAGPGKLRSDASVCPRKLVLNEVEQWLKDAIRDGAVSAQIDLFPQYVWTRREGRVFEARLSNSVLGEYHGYPIHDHEAPRWLT